MKKLFQVLLTVLIGALLFNTIGCSDDDGPTAPPVPPVPTILEIVVKSSLDSSLIENSNVVIFQAETKDAITRDLTDINGECEFEFDQGNYYVELAAQGFDPSPAENVTPIPFFVTEKDTTEKIYYLNPNAIANSGYIKGYVNPAINNFLILAESTTDKYATISGPDGFFIMYNLPYDTYSFEALKAGYKMDSDTTVTISAGAVIDSVTIRVSEYVGSTLSGSITFLATTDTLDVDVVLRDPETGAVIPGLTANEDGGNYTLAGIPDGDYKAWASFENDGYVLDPDWVFKNPTGLDISFSTAGTLTLDFSVTGAINILSPTNPADSIYAFMADSIVPIFKWEEYPSTGEYIIEVRDLSGNRIWGGFEADGTVNHAFLEADSVEFDFDGTATEALVPGEIYQWKIWADKGSPPVDSFVQQLISTSEDLRGIFQVPELPRK